MSSSLCRLVTLSSRLTRINGAAPLSVVKQPKELFANAKINPFSSSQALNLSLTTRKEGKGKILPSTHWNAERLMSIASLAVIPPAFFLNHPLTDSLMALIFVIHTHWGFEAIALDYTCRNLIMNKPVPELLGKLAIAFVYLLSILTLAACIKFNMTDVGLTKAVLMLWTL